MRVTLHDIYVRIHIGKMKIPLVACENKNNRKSSPQSKSDCFLHQHPIQYPNRTEYTIFIEIKQRNNKTG